jgi:monoamine oxidase
MAAQAKCLVTYPHAFWRDQGLSGQAFSQIGPMVELHDASLGEKLGPALFGFIGVPARQRMQVSQQELQNACIEQLVFFYGEQARKFDAIEIKDWALEDNTCTGLDIQEPPRHPEIDLSPFQEELVTNNLFFVGSEFSIQEPGYLEGALHSVDAALDLVRF